MTAAARPESGEPLVSVVDLHVEIEGHRGGAKVLNGVSFELGAKETLGLVGESGSGKTMTLMALLGLLPPGAKVTQGYVEWRGGRLDFDDERRLRKLRGGEIGTILQDPTASLNPVLQVGYQVAEPLVIHRRLSAKKARRAAVGLLKDVGIGSPEDSVKAYPHQFSGGMRQRILGAAAISCDPVLLLADEPTTALDVTVQAEYLELIERLQRETGAALLYVSHDLAVVARVCDRVAVMYGGRIMEVAPTAEIFNGPRHPYTIGLLNCLPSQAGFGERLNPISGQPPDPRRLPAGCPFAPRCPAAESRCTVASPPLLDVGPPGHTVACVRADERLHRQDLYARQTEGTHG